MRDTFLDTNKALLIFLVVFGHFLEKMVGWETQESRAVLSFIYFIHMPAFIFISGLLFKDKNYIKNIIFFLALYLPFQFLYPMFDSVLKGEATVNWQNWLERPYWILWYLMGMMAWTLLTHYLIKTAIPCFIAFLLAVMVGFSPWNNYQYSIGRIFVFLPFFVVGAVYGQSLIAFIKQQKYASLYGLGILTLLFGCLNFFRLSEFWLYGSLSYAQMKVSSFDGSMIRLGCLLISSLGIYAVLAVMKCWDGKLTHLGAYTLPVYLLHGFVVLVLAHYWTLGYAEWINIFITFVLSVMTCCMLQFPMFDRLLRHLSQWLMWPYTRICRLRSK